MTIKEILDKSVETINKHHKELIVEEPEQIDWIKEYDDSDEYAKPYDPLLDDDNLSGEDIYNGQYDE